MSLAASIGLKPGHADGDFLSAGDAETVVGHLKTLAKLAHPKSREWNPIRCLEPHGVGRRRRLRTVPLQLRELFVRLFGAPDHLRRSPDRRERLAGAHAARWRRHRRQRQDRRIRKAAFDYAMYLCSPDYQSTDYVIHGGQPGSRTAWQSDACNALTGGFFRNTLPVMDQAYLRPTHAGVRSVLPRRDAETRGSRVRGCADPAVRRLAQRQLRPHPAGGGQMTTRPPNPQRTKTSPPPASAATRCRLPRRRSTSSSSWPANPTG